ncbi:hypothetical protein [Micromonospora sp. WMMD708]|uniref:hypothetical protein n=1 Tax=Micromonospora sp. WMMD708 TaxID=3403464 RepID=UPI003BF53762
MPSTVGQWLVVILALLVGLAGGWALWGRQKPTAAVAPIVEGDPVVGLTPEEKAAATIDAPRPAATVDDSPAPTAVVDEPTPHVAPDPDQLTPATTGSAASADPTASAGEDVAVNGTSSTVAADRTAPLPDLADEPTTLDLTGRVTPGDAPTGGVTEETAAPVPAPRATVEDTPDSAAADLPDPTPADPEPAATAPVTASEATPAAEPAPAPGSTPADEPNPAGEPNPVDVSNPVDDPAPVDVVGSPAGVAEPEPAGVAEAEPAGAPGHTSPPVADVDDVPVAAEPVIPTQRTPDADNTPVPDSTPVSDGAPADSAPVADSAPASPDAVVAEVAAAQDEPVDDFRRIQGVGPKMAAALQAAGIRSYRQLAALDETSLRETIRAAGLRATASLATWPQQAQVLAGAGAEAERVLPTPTGGDSQD